MRTLLKNCQEGGRPQKRRRPLRGRKGKGKLLVEGIACVGKLEKQMIPRRKSLAKLLKGAKAGALVAEAKYEGVFVVFSLI